MSSSFSFASDLNSEYVTERTWDIPGITSPFKNNFVNVEIQEVVLTNIKKSLDDIDGNVKVTKNALELKELFKSTGDLVENNILKFNNVALERDVSFNNTYSRISLDETKKSGDYKINNSSNSYKIDLLIYRSEKDTVQFSIKGNITADNAGQNSDPYTKSGMSNLFEQSTGVKVNQYTVFSTVSNLGETRFLIIKVSNPTIQE
jgi:hypothetical protein